MIHFGTDGWRGIIADDFTFENVRIVSQAVCDYVNVTPSPQPSPPRGEDKDEGAKPTLIIGYDTRFLSDKFAREAACVAAGNGIKVLLTESFAPTPAVSYAVVDYKADGAIMFTASHNPYRYNGLKFKALYGGSATPEITAEIEHHLEKNIKAKKKPAVMDFEKVVTQETVQLFDPKKPYLQELAKLVDIKLLKKSSTTVVVDPMYGAGQGYLSDFLRQAGCDVKEIRGWRDPYFGGDNPEPFLPFLSELQKTVKGKYSLGLALDGDADRIGAIDISGEFINSHMVFALLLKYLYEEKGLTGDVVKTVSTTSMIDKLAGAYDLKLHETPIGFKYICDKMLEGDVLIGGEESGGIGIKNHIPERDGILMGALLVEMMNFYNKTLFELWNKLQETYGRFCLDRIDMEIDNEAREKILTFLSDWRPKEISGLVVTHINSSDGYKYQLANGAWLMIRPSGTEAVVRIYVEADKEQLVRELLVKGRDIVTSAGQS